MSDYLVEVVQVGPNEVSVQEFRHTVTVNSDDPNQIAIALVGQQGPPGSQLLMGNGPPDNTVGRTGDFWIDQEFLRLYGPKETTGWPSEYFNIAGATALEDLNDVSVTDPEEGDVLTYDGSQWTNQSTGSALTITNGAVSGSIGLIVASTSNDDEDQLIDSSDGATAIKYMIRVAAGNGTIHESLEIMANVFSGGVDFVEYGRISSGGSLGEFDLVKSGSVVELRVSPSTDSVVVYRVLKHVIAG